jgi:Flp pilus assembly pilin Flp
MVNSVFQALRALRNDRRGLTAFDYALIGSWVAVAVIAGLYTYGSNVSAEFSLITAVI